MMHQVQSTNKTKFVSIFSFSLRFRNLSMETYPFLFPPIHQSCLTLPPSRTLKWKSTMHVSSPKHLAYQFFSYGLLTALIILHNVAQLNVKEHSAW